jgi:hypothetical protein
MKTPTIASSLLLVLLLILVSGCSGIRSLAGRIFHTNLPLVQDRGEAPSPCAGHPAVLVTDLLVYQTPDLAEPLPRVAYRDPVFGTCITRVTDRRSDRSADDPSAGLKNEYSRVRSFNSDGSRLIVRGITATWYLYDSATLMPITILPFCGQVDPRWDSSDPTVIYYVEEARLMACDVDTLTLRTVHDFHPDLPGQTLAAVWTRGEGSPSLDGRYWGFMAEDADWEPVELLVYDQVEDRIISRRAVSGAPDIDNVTISPSGDYFLAWYDYCEPGQMGSDANPCGLMAWDRNLQNGRGLLRIPGHGDLALDAAGREVLVYQDIETDYISMLDLASGAITPLRQIDFGHTAIGLHFSGRAFARPGWAAVSTYNGGYPSAFTWMDDQVFVIELRANGRVARLAHTHSRYDESIEQDYWAEPHTSANADLTRILFTSNWGRSGTEEVDVFVIDLPADWPERLD